MRPYSLILADWVDVHSQTKGSWPNRLVGPIRILCYALRIHEIEDKVVSFEHYSSLYVEPERSWRSCRVRTDAATIPKGKGWANIHQKGGLHEQKVHRKGFTGRGGRVRTLALSPDRRSFESNYFHYFL